MILLEQLQSNTEHSSFKKYFFLDNCPRNLLEGEYPLDMVDCPEMEATDSKCQLPIIIPLLRFPSFTASLAPTASFPAACGSLRLAIAKTASPRAGPAMPDTGPISVWSMTNFLVPQFQICYHMPALSISFHLHSQKEQGTRRWLTACGCNDGITQAVRAGLLWGNNASHFGVRQTEGCKTTGGMSKL